MLVNDCNLPEPIFHALKVNTYDGGNYDYSATGILDSPKLIIGKKLVLSDPGYKMLASDMMYTFLGHLFHHALELRLDEAMKQFVNIAGKYRQEDRMVHNFLIKGKKVSFSGQLDNADIHNKIIYDYKSTIVGGYNMRHKKIKKWEKQINIYNGLSKVERGITYLRAYVIQVLMDWRKPMFPKKDYPDSPFPMVKINLYNPDWIMSFIEKKIEMMESFSSCKLEDIPYCDEETRWQDPAVFKVCKINKNGSMPKSPRAVPGGVFNSLNDANAFLKTKGNGYGIHNHPSEPTNCLHFCPVAKAGLCDYGKLFKQGKV